MGEQNLKGGQKQLSEEFLNDYKQLCLEFDKLEHETLFKGAQMELLTRKFLEKHRAHMRVVSSNTLPEQVKCLVKYDLDDECDERSWSELLEDDLRVLQSSHELKPDKIDIIAYERRDDDIAGAKKSRSNSITLSPPDINLHELTREPHKLIADVYRRACEACYLRVTFNMARLKQDDDRREAIRLAQRAIRHDPNNFKACYFYMISCGWYLDSLSIISNVKERILGGETFKTSIKRCIELNPKDALSHHLLGRYYYHVASLTWLSRSVAKNLLNMEVEGDYKDAERELKLAHELYGNWLPTGLWMARVLLAQGGRRDEIASWIKWAIKLDAREPTTEIERQELLELAKKLKVI